MLHSINLKIPGLEYDDRYGLVIGAVRRLKDREIWGMGAQQRGMFRRSFLRVAYGMEIWTFLRLGGSFCGC
jgi:hypothetical protein